MPRPKLADTEKLVSFPVRMTQRQMARLERIAVSDGLPVAEHMRRALDLYTEAREIEYNLPFLPLGTLPGSAAPPVAEDAALREPAPPAVPPSTIPGGIPMEMTGPLPPAPTLVVAPAPVIPLPPPEGHPMAGSSVDALLNDLGLGADLPEIDGENQD